LRAVRVAFFGLPLAALLLHGDGIDVVLAALSRRPALGTRRLTRLLGPDRVLSRREAEASGFRARLREAAPDLLVSWFWTRRLPREVLEVPRLGAIGVHPSLLPRHRGPDPYFWAIEAGDVETGVTAHRLDETYDTGAILAARRVRLDAGWNAWTLAKRLDRPSLALLREVVGAFARGRPPAEVPQLEDQATAAPEPDDALLELRWGNPSSRVVRRIRAASPWPGAFTHIGESVVTLTHARATDDYPRALIAGEAAVRPDGVAVVRTSDGAVELLAGRDADDAELAAEGLARLVRDARDR
jgi:methionyl-tRNA formyltransferase